MSPWGRPPSEGPWPYVGKNPRASQGKVKASLFKEIHIPQAECSPLRSREQPWAVGVVSFYGLSNSIQE